MDKGKIPLIVLVILFLGSAFFAFRFYAESQNLTQKNQALIQENKDISRMLEKYKTDYRDLSAKNKELAGRVKDIKEELDRIERERNDFRARYEEISRERESLIEEVKKLKAVRVERPSIAPEEVSDAYWQDIVQQKAEFQFQVEELTAQLKEQLSKTQALENKNEELTAQLRQLQKTKAELERQINFNSRTIDILTKDLVREKEDKNAILKEIDELKAENVTLAREAKLAKGIRKDLEKALAKNEDTKLILERKVKDMETILREKAVEMEALQRQLSQVITSAKEVMPRQTKAVELPPIVVKSETKPSLPSTLLEGKVLAVNEKERFVIVDLGKSSGLKPGDIFSVIRNEEKIAFLEIIETRQDISACDIKEVKRRIREGDIVRFNP